MKTKILLWLLGIAIIPCFSFATSLEDRCNLDWWKVYWNECMFDLDEILLWSAWNNFCNLWNYFNWNCKRPENKDFSQEMIAAYNWSYSKWITTMETIKQANTDKEITRAELAKMISNYAISIGKTAESNDKCIFIDTSEELDHKYDDWIKLSCQFWLMWQWTNKFRPNDSVTRAEFWTVLSRMLFNTENWTDKYYSTHLAKLKSEWIISNDNPDLKELRWYVMLMLMRSKDNKKQTSQESGDINYLKVVVHNPFFYDDTSVVYPYPTNISEEQDNGWFMLHHNWLKRWDILQISYTGDLQTNTGSSYKELKNVVSVSLLWNIKDDYFKVRNNIPYEFKSSWYQDKPTIDSYILSWDFIDGKDWSSMTYETWYSYTYKDLWLKISTPTWWRSEFPLADSENIFSRNWVEIRRNWKDPIAPMRVEYIKVYAKDKNQSLKEVITERHFNPWCELITWNIVDGL